MDKIIYSCLILQAIFIAAFISVALIFPHDAGAWFARAEAGYHIQRDMLYGKPNP